jgi:hypothetical protein
MTEQANHEIETTAIVDGPSRRMQLARLLASPSPEINPGRCRFGKTFVSVGQGGHPHRCAQRMTRAGGSGESVGRDGQRLDSLPQAYFHHREEK